VAQDQRADPLRLAVVRVVVAGGERIRAEHDAPLHLRAETGGAALRVHLARCRRLDPQAVAHAVVAGQVARCFRRSDEVVGRQAVAARLSAAASTVAVNGPIWSRLDANATSP